MNKVFTGMLLLALTIIATVTHSYAGADELAQLLESKVFWSTYKWGTLEDSELYKAATWKLAGGSSSENTQISDKYVTSINIPGLRSELISMSVNTQTNKINSFDINLINSSNNDDYAKLVTWCNGIFGDSSVETKKTHATGKIARETITSTWDVENTIIVVKTENRLSKDPRAVGSITTLSFIKNYRSQSDIPGEVPAKKLIGVHAKKERPVRKVIPLQVIERHLAPRPKPYIPRGMPLPSEGHNDGPDSANPQAVSPQAVKPVAVKTLQPPPYIWEDETGTMHATSDILDVPQNKRAMFESDAQK
jgi:hypothetical protein